MRICSASDDEALVSFFRSTTDLGDKAQRLSVQTFKVLCRFGDPWAAAAADAIGDEVDKDDVRPSEPPAAVQSTTTQPTPRTPAVTSGGVSLTVNLQLQLPVSADGEVYDKLSPPWQHISRA
jgi:hypothetical protein